ncbi:GSF2 [Candida pseudojiufengensis]|uniref:GSF2 n=1 Tax=Candida pseudojiufengensis TaxID=497109 RepID=UPI0022255E32|nr:GSF2 [Candida pseudojiufengensis]KAI5961164.1 GSF2 [Candida pseudojiufengensis]
MDQQIKRDEEIVQESEEIAFLDIYIRFNEDSEKDYCFQINTKTTFKDLYKIFNTIPISLRPSVFYNSKPIGFKKSTSPGFLTEDGNFLFDENSDKFTSSIIPLEEFINNHVWPGQLILPIWEFNYFSFYSVLSLLAIWLYTDLPDFISPTPGLCLTNQFTKILAYIVNEVGYPSISEMLIKDLEDEVSIVTQCIFFAFHILKLGFIFGFLYTGVFNPIKVFRFGSGVKLDVSKEELIKLGWTGTKKATIDEYKDYYREYKIQQHGGMIQAHQAGLFKTIRHLGIQLQKGEGYNTELTKTTMMTTMNDLLKESEDNKSTFKLKLNYEWFAELGYVFASLSENKEGKELANLIKQFRRYGLLNTTPKIETIIANRKERDIDTSLDPPEKINQLEELLKEQPIDDEKNDEPVIVDSSEKIEEIKE